MNFKKKLKTRLYTAITYIVLGTLMIVGGLITNTTNEFISCFGFALVVIGIANIRKYYIITKNEESIKKQEITETDERTISIVHKARSTTFSIYIFLSCTVVIILSLLNMHDIAKWIAYSVLLLISIYWICYFVYQKKL